jgi:hypothetical protein
MVIGNQERKSQPRSINPRERNFEPVVVPGVRVVFVTVFDAQLRQLSKTRLNFIGRDAFYSIQVDATQTVRLVEVRLPPPGPGMPFGAMPGQGFQGMQPPVQPPAKPAVPLIPPPNNTTGPILPKKK